MIKRFTKQKKLKMSLIEEPRQENDQKETEVQEDDELDPEDCNGEDVQVKDFLKTSQEENRTVRPLTLFKEDLSQFKQGVLRVFKDKDTNPTTSQSAEKLINPLTLLKEEFNQFKDDLSSVFRSSLSKELDNKNGAMREDSSKSFKIKVSKAKRADEPIKSLFRRDQSPLKTSQKPEDVQEARKTLSGKSEEQTDDAFHENFSEQSEETVDAKKTNDMKERVNESEDNKLDINVSEEKTEMIKSFSERQQSEEICASKTAHQRHESEEFSEEEDDKPSETLHWETLSSGFTLFSLRDANKDDMRNQSGADLWSLKNFACYLTLDPNTANSELHLTEGNRKATRIWLDHRSSSHPERFERCPQVLCREGLLDSVYWEVVWSGGADIGVTYNNISRNGDTASCLLGHNKRSWSLECSEGSYTPCHDNKRFKSSSPQPFTHRVGVYLNWSDGSLSFYCVSQDAMVHLHTFTSTFTEPLYPGFWVWAYDGSVSLCHVELDWERLLQ